MAIYSLCGRCLFVLGAILNHGVFGTFYRFFVACTKYVSIAFVFFCQNSFLFLFLVSLHSRDYPVDQVVWFPFIFETGHFQKVESTILVLQEVAHKLVQNPVFVWVKEHLWVRFVGLIDLSDNLGVGSRHALDGTRPLFLLDIDTLILSYKICFVCQKKIKKLLSTQQFNDFEKFHLPSWSLASLGYSTSTVNKFIRVPSEKAYWSLFMNSVSEILGSFRMPLFFCLIVSSLKSFMLTYSWKSILSSFEPAP